MEVDEQPDVGDEDSCLRDSMLDHLSLNNEAHFKSQQLNEPDLTPNEKRQIAEDILTKSPGRFLSRFGKYLLKHHLEFFTLLANDDFEVNYYINDLRKELSKPENNKSLVRNRRLEALKRLSRDSEYFSDDEMRKRNPIMFEHLVGQFLSDDEKILFQREKQESQSFTSIILNAIDESAIKEKLKSKAEIEEDSETESEISSDEEPTISKYAVWGEFSTNQIDNIEEKHKKRPTKHTKQTEALSEEEKALLVNEFRSRVYSDFLGGKDSEFDYSKVDMNREYDDLDMLEVDQQDEYFDSETPEIISKGDGSSDSSNSHESSKYLPPKSLAQKMADLGK